MTQSILIGKGRRVTIDELRAVSTGAASLESTSETPSAGADLSASLSRLSLSDATLLSPSVTRAALTLLAMTLSRGNCREVDLSDRLVDVVNHCEGMTLPGVATEFVKALGEDGNALLEGGKAKEFVGRAIGLARIALSLSTGECVRCMYMIFYTVHFIV